MRKKASKKTMKGIDEARMIAGRLFAYADKYLTAVCEVVVYANDGSSERRMAMLNSAMRCRQELAELAEALEALR